MLHTLPLCKFLAVLLIGSGLFLSNARAQVMIDGSVGSGSGYEQVALGSNGGSQTVQLSVGNNSGRMLVAVVTSRTTSGSRTINELSFGGDDFVSTGVSAVADFDLTTEFFYLLNPTTTANSDLVADITGVNRGAGVAVFSLYDTAGTAPTVFGTPQVGNNSSAGSSTITASTTQPDTFLMTAISVRDPANAQSNTGDQTTSFLDWNPSGNTSRFRYNVAVGTKSLAAPGSTSLEWSWTGGDDPTDFAHAAVQIAPIPEPSTALLLSLGLGAVVLSASRRR